jgi:hypothetical protein
MKKRTPPETRPYFLCFGQLLFNLICLLTCAYRPRKEYIESSPIVGDILEQLHEDGQVSADAVHDEEKDTDAHRANVPRHNFNNHCEQNGEPSFS